jgi:predicted metal-dependent hydrolase
MIEPGTNLTRRSDAPLILHCHIPKTAGMTVSDGFKKSFALCHVHHYHPDPHYLLNQEILDNLLEINPALLSISSHHLRSFPLSVKGRPTFFVTFLRRPEDAFISQLRFVQREFSSLSSEVKLAWPKNTPDLPLRDLARQYLEVVTASQDFSPQTRFFCNPASMAKQGLVDGHQYGLDSYEIARSILEGFHFVGIVEEMKKSLELLSDRLLQRGIRVYFDLNVKLNSSHASTPDWLTMEDEVGRRVLDASKSDQRLYQYFLERLFKPYSELRKRRWLGFKPAAADAREALSAGWRDAAHSLIHSASLYRTRRTACQEQEIPSEVCSELLEVRAARAVSASPLAEAAHYH